MDFIYNLLKDLILFFKYKDEEKLVEFNYPVRIGIAERSLWCNLDELDRRLSQGFTIYYDKDSRVRKRYYFVNKSKKILLLRP